MTLKAKKIKGKPGEADGIGPPASAPSAACSENLQRRGVVSATVRFHDDLHVLVERYQEAQKAFHGKLPELTAQHLGNIGLPDSEQPGGLYLLEAASF